MQESVNGNVAETCSTVLETRRITCVSVTGFVTFSRVSVAAYTTEPDHFYVNITETWSCMFPPCFRNTETCDFVLCIFGAISSGKNILMGKWHLIENQRTESHRKGKSLKYMMEAEVKNRLRMPGVLEALRASTLFNSSFASCNLHPARGVGRNNSSKKLRETTKLTEIRDNHLSHLAQTPPFLLFYGSNAFLPRPDLCNDQAVCRVAY